MEEEIVACAFKNKETGKIYLSRKCHAEIIGMFFKAEDKETAKKCEQGFITNFDRFVNRKEALKIAQKAKQELHKICESYELYSEDIFYNISEELRLKKELEKKDKIIGLMAEEICKRADCPAENYDTFLDCQNKCKNGIEKECWKKYFENEATKQHDLKG